MINKRKLKLRKFLAVVLCAATVFSMTACQKSPKSSIVVNKDLDKLIEKAKAPKENEEEVNSVLVEENYDTYKTTIEDKNLHVKATVDAKVDIPKDRQDVSISRISEEDDTGTARCSSKRIDG